MEPKKLEPKQLLKAIDFLGNQISSADNIHTYSESPIHILVHNEILKFPKEEIDSCKESLRFGNDFFNLCFKIRNPYIFSAFLKIGAFQDKISDETKWLLRQKKDPSNELYAAMYSIERARLYKSTNEKELSDKEILFHNLLGEYTYKFDTPEKIEIIDNYFKEFGKEMESELINHIYENHGRYHSEICDYLVIKLKNNNVDLSKNKLLNKVLPKKDFRNEEQSFFISSLETPKVKKLLECGFKFDEKSYSHNGDNLFIAVVKSKRTDLIDLILPYLKDVTPKNGTVEEQTAFIDSLADNAKKPADIELYKRIQATYHKCLLNQNLNNKNIEDKPKLKV